MSSVFQRTNFTPFMMSVFGLKVVNTSPSILFNLLLYIQKCGKPSRISVNRILALFRENSHSKNIYLTPDFYKDIHWFLTFLPSYNGISFIKKNVVDSNQALYLDACWGSWWQSGNTRLPPLRPGFVSRLGLKWESW